MIQDFLSTAAWFYIVIIVTSILLVVSWVIERKHVLQHQRYERTKAKLHKEAQEKFHFMTLEESLRSLQKEKFAEHTRAINNNGNFEEVAYEMKVLDAELYRLFKEYRENLRVAIDKESGFELTKSAQL